MIQGASDVIEAAVLEATMKGIPEIASLVEWDGLHKIFWNHVEDGVDNPYIVMNHFSGGDEKDDRYSDSYWIIYGHTADMSQVPVFKNALAKLKGVIPDTSMYDEVCAYAPLKQAVPYFFRYQVQNVPFFRSGGIFRIRLFLGSKDDS